MAKDEIQITAKIGRKLTAEEEKNKESAQVGHAQTVDVNSVQGQGMFFLMCPVCGAGAWYSVPPFYHECPNCGDLFYWA
jgi:rubrerythrin